MAYENLIKPYENDFGTAIQALIQDNIKNINTAFIAKVQSISEDKKKVNIVNVIKNEASNQNVVIPNVLIAQPYSSEWQISFKVGVGDIGLAIVCKEDIANYKQSGADSKANTKRHFDITDSVFIPLSLYLQKENDNLGFSVKNKNGDCELSFSAEGKLSIKAKEVEVTSQSPISIGTSQTLLDCFNAIIDNLQTAIIGGVTSGSPTTQTITTLPNYTAQAQIMKQTIQAVLK